MTKSTLRLSPTSCTQWNKFGCCMHGHPPQDCEGGCFDSEIGAAGSVQEDWEQEYGAQVSGVTGPRLAVAGRNELRLEA